MPELFLHVFIGILLDFDPADDTDRSDGAIEPLLPGLFYWSKLAYLASRFPCYVIGLFAPVTAGNPSLAAARLNVFVPRLAPSAAVVVL